MAGPTELQQIFSGVLTPLQLQQNRQQRNEQLHSVYQGNESWRADLQKSLDTFAVHTPGTPEYQQQATANNNQQVLNDATKKYQSHVDAGLDPSDAQLKVLDDAMRTFAAHGNYEAIGALAPAYMAMQHQQAQVAKLYQETRKSAVDTEKTQQDTALAPILANNTLLNGQSTRASQAASANKTNADAAKQSTANIVDLANPEKGSITATISPQTGNATYTDPTTGHVVVRKPGQYLDKGNEAKSSTKGTGTIADSMQPAMLGSVKLDIKEIRAGLDKMKSLTTDTTGLFFNDDKVNPLASLLHRGATLEKNQQYEVQANRMAVAIASAQSMGRGQVSNAKVNEARKLVPQPGDKPKTIQDKLAKISQIADQAEETLYQDRSDASSKVTPKETAAERAKRMGL